MNTVRVLGHRYLTGRKTPKLYFLFLSVRDWLLRAWWRRSVPPRAKALLSNVVVSKLDHFGDLLMITPLLVELKRQRPAVRILLLIGSWNDSLAELLREAGLCDSICHYDAPTLNRVTPNLVTRVRRFAKTFWRSLWILRKERPDTFIDLRPYSPNTLFLARMCRIPFRIGFGLRGLAFTLHEVIQYDEVKPLGQLYLDSLPLLGLHSAEYEGPFLPATKALRVKNHSAETEDSNPYIVFQPASGDPSKEIELEVWLKILEVLCPRVKILMLGGKIDIPLGRQLEVGRSRDQFESRAGRTTLREAAVITEKSRGCIGVDSFFAHVGLAYSLPVFVLAVRNSHRLAFPKEHPDFRYIEVQDPNFDPEQVARNFLDVITISDVAGSPPF